MNYIVCENCGGRTVTEDGEQSCPTCDITNFLAGIGVFTILAGLLWCANYVWQHISWTW